MFCPRVIPVLSLKGKGLVKTIGFNKKNARYIGDPINAVRIFNDLEADELIFLDIMASLENRCIDLDLIKSVGDEAYMPFSAGGGITTIEEIGKIIQAGAERVILNTSAFKKIGLIEEAVLKFGSQSIIVSVDVKKNIFGKRKVYIKDGTESIEEGLVDYLKKIEKSGAGEVMINSIDQDGSMEGYDHDLLKLVCETVQIPIIACGGAGNLQHLKNAYNATRVNALAAGSIFIYHGSRNAVLINYPEKNEIFNIFT